MRLRITVPDGVNMRISRLIGTISVGVALITSAYADKVTYDFTGTVTDAGVIAGVSGAIGDGITGEFTYDTLTEDGNPNDTTIGYYWHTAATVSPVTITLPSGSIRWDPDTAVIVNVASDINIAARLPDPTTPGNNIDHDIIFHLKSTSSALATDALPASIDLTDFHPVTGIFSSFSIQNGPAGDPIGYSIDTLTIRTQFPPLNGVDSGGWWRRIRRLK